MDDVGRGAPDAPHASRAPAGPAATPALFRRWLVLSALGLAVGLPLALALLDPLELLVGMVLVTPLVFGIAGAILGLSQWLALRHPRHPLLWIGLCAAGLALGLTGATVGIEAVGRALAGTPTRIGNTPPLGLAAAFGALGALGGLTLGAAQWVYLRRWFEGAGLWLLASGGGLALGMVGGFALSYVFFGGVTTGPGMLVVLSTAAVTSGAITGHALVRYARRAASALGAAEAG